LEWESLKEASHLHKHGISFVAAGRVLQSQQVFIFLSDRPGEGRWLAIGMNSGGQRTIAVAQAMGPSAIASSRHEGREK
jgi:uncharacterized DUF497 family protein